MDDSNTFRLEHNRKVTLFDYHGSFLPMSHTFRGYKWSFLKGKTIRNGPPKQKLGADIIKMPNNIKESENGGFKGYGEKHD
jgi:hypothetical protein